MATVPTGADVSKHDSRLVAGSDHRIVSAEQVRGEDRANPDHRIAVDPVELASESDQLWQVILAEARQLSLAEPILASFYHACIINHKNLASALSYYLAAKLDSAAVPAMLIRQVINEAIASQPYIISAACADIYAYYERDPACDQYAMPLLYFKGFHAIQAYRVAHFLWHQDRRGLARFLQHRIATLFDVDIHPAAQLGCGVMVDHATGLVIGETAVVADNVSMLHSVTLGGSGTGSGRRHPFIEEGVLISAGAKVLGSIRVGRGAKIAAGSVVLNDVAAHTTVAGVPAVPVGKPAGDSPALDMNHQFSD